jgi:hypothetical protein
MGMAGDFTDEVELMRLTILHFANQIHAERARADRLQRQLDCERERLALLELSSYGRPLL